MLVRRQWIQLLKRMPSYILSQQSTSLTPPVPRILHFSSSPSHLQHGLASEGPCDLLFTLHLYADVTLPQTSSSMLWRATGPTYRASISSTRLTRSASRSSVRLNVCVRVCEREIVCVSEREWEKWKKREWERVRRRGRGETEREGESGWERDRRQTNRRAYQEPAIQLRAYLFFDFSSLFVARYHLQNPAHGSHLGPPQVELRLPAWEDVGLPQASEDLHQAEGTGKRLGLSGCGPFLGTMILMLLLWNALSVRQS